jgi:hypothetical protein
MQGDRFILRLDVQARQQASSDSFSRRLQGLVSEYTGKAPLSVAASSMSAVSRRLTSAASNMPLD